jgi:hypothetical protein
LASDGWDLALFSAVHTRTGSGWRVIAAFARQLPGTGGAVIALTSDHTVGNLVRFLLSDPGQWINGQLLYSNGDFPEGRLPL